MLPQKNFDYKSVDFSSFQGGSLMGDVSTQFHQQKVIISLHTLESTLFCKYSLPIEF